MTVTLRAGAYFGLGSGINPSARHIPAPIVARGWTAHVVEVLAPGTNALKANLEALEPGAGFTVQTTIPYSVWWTPWGSPNLPGSPDDRRLDFDQLLQARADRLHNAVRTSDFRTAIRAYREITGVETVYLYLGRFWGTRWTTARGSANFERLVRASVEPLLGLSNVGVMIDAAGPLDTERDPSFEALSILAREGVSIGWEGSAVGGETLPVKSNCWLTLTRPGLKAVQFDTHQTFNIGLNYWTIDPNSIAADKYVLCKTLTPNIAQYAGWVKDYGICIGTSGYPGFDAGFSATFLGNVRDQLDLITK